MQSWAEAEGTGNQAPAAANLLRETILHSDSDLLRQNNHTSRHSSLRPLRWRFFMKTCQTPKLSWSRVEHPIGRAAGNQACQVRRAPILCREAGSWLSKSGSRFEFIGRASTSPAQFEQHVMSRKVCPWVKSHLLISDTLASAAFTSRSLVLFWLAPRSCDERRVHTSPERRAQVHAASSYERACVCMHVEREREGEREKERERERERKRESYVCIYIYIYMYTYT